MYNFNFQNKLFNLFIFQFNDKMTNEDLNNYKNDINKILSLKLNNIFIVYDIRKVKTIDMNCFVSNINSLFEFTNLLKGIIKGCSIIVNNKYINTIKMIFKILPNKICDSFIITKEAEEAFLYLNNLHNNNKISNIKLEL